MAVRFDMLRCTENIGLKFHFRGNYSHLITWSTETFKQTAKQEALVALMPVRLPLHQRLTVLSFTPTRSASCRCVSPDRVIASFSVIGLITLNVLHALPRVKFFFGLSEVFFSWYTGGRTLTYDGTDI